MLASCATPVTEPFLIDRVLAIAQMQGVPALVVVNKDDLASAQPLAEIYRKAGVSVLVTSAETGEGIEALREALNGKLSCLTGNSGVGKSSLLNRACPQLQLPVGEVSEKLGRGRHTTRHIELYSFGGGTFVADTPGFSAFDTERMELVHKEQLQYACLLYTSLPRGFYTAWCRTACCWTFISRRPYPRRLQNCSRSCLIFCASAHIRFYFWTRSPSPPQSMKRSNRRRPMRTNALPVW